ncbi:MAG: flotillin-like protein FloA [Novipirellula sp. JB048]
MELFAAIELPNLWQVLTGVSVVGLILGIALIGIFTKWGSYWFQAYMSGADISMKSLVVMSLLQIEHRPIVTAKIMASQAGLSIDRKTGMSTHRLQAHHLAGGDVMNVVQAQIAAQRAGIDLDFDRAAAIDLAGRDVLLAVQTSVSPKVIHCPSNNGSGSATLSAVAKNGVELRVGARVTVRTNLDQLIGGATEETVVARVGQGIITAIGGADSHMDVLEMPSRISKGAMQHGLDTNTAFAIVSIDIYDIDVGENIGARLQSDQANADTRIARAVAEERRAEAVALEQQRSADVTRNRAAVVLAEAKVPEALAAAFRDGTMRRPGQRTNLPAAATATLVGRAHRRPPAGKTAPPTPTSTAIPNYVLLAGKERIGPPLSAPEAASRYQVIYGFSDKQPYDTFCASTSEALTPYPLVKGYLQTQLEMPADRVRLVVLDAAAKDAPQLHAATMQAVLDAMNSKATEVTASFRLTLDPKTQSYDVQPLS